MDERFIKAVEILAEQEEKLQFDHFSEEDAWDLTTFFVQQMKEKNCPMGIVIRKLNGSVITQYMPAMTSKHNDVFMTKKFNTTALTEKSSLHFTAFLNLVGETLKGQCMNYDEHIGCGGAFPIRVKGTGTVAVLTVSRLRHEEDHEFIVDGLSKYLGVEVPRLDMEIPIILE